MINKFLVFGLGVGLMAAMPLHADDRLNFILIVKVGRFSPEKIEVTASQGMNLNVNNDGPGPEEFE